MIVLGIGGFSGSGKSTLSEKIQTYFGSERTAVLALDQYYHDFIARGIDPVTVNYDHPESIDFDLLCEHLKTLRCGDAVGVPVYDFSTHRRTEDIHPLEPRKIIILEGTLIYASPLIRDMIDHRIYIDLAESVCLKRRIKRDMKARGRNRDDIIRQYLQYVGPSQKTFILPFRD